MGDTMISFAQYWQDRCRGAWANYRTSGASLAFLYRHAVVWRRMPFPSTPEDAA